MHDTTGEGLSETLLKTCTDLKLNLHHLRGQGYDGAGAMSGKFKGCAARISTKYPGALYVHCANHSFNLSVECACKIRNIRNCISSINEIINFFRISAKRQNILNDAIDKMECEITKKRLKRYCATRWIDRLEAIITFKDFFYL